MATKLKSKQGLKDYLVLLSQLRPVGPEAQAALLKRCAKGDAEAVREMTEAWLPKVLAWVSPRRGEALSFQELIALGNCALIETVKSYRGKCEDFESAACQAVHQALDTAFKIGA